MKKLNDIGFRIKKIREEQNISQEDLANQLNISQSRLSKIENGNIKKIDLLFFINTCQVLAINISDFLDQFI
ncbi:helix-turn-helix domain-containing protein [Elizabethkingia anophelis]|uniref:helix-turn-helix domain-containing protein n=1 Tax=Elizabethkingia anophelis TaxID=1117645 RepID=UPI00246888BB|nr:helix-turn-helix transcriptional regulator [Elizabethkingia anophelis]WGL70575.1 helix-turn-helix transcriptional regulator [Elizabethkingia anophelis]